MATLDFENQIDNPVLVDDNPPSKDEQQNVEQQLNNSINSLSDLTKYLRESVDARNALRNYQEAEQTKVVTNYLQQIGAAPTVATMEALPVHDPYGDPNMFMDRYQAFSDTYDKFGFSPYRDNESIYMSNASGWEKTKVALKAFAHLTWISLEQNSFFASGRTDNDRVKNLAREYNYWNTIGMDSGEGFGAFARNLLVTYGSTAAVMLKMAVEEIAINVGMSLISGGSGTAATVTGSSARFVRFAKFMERVRDGLKMSNTIRKLWSKSSIGGRLAYTGAEFIAPGLVTGITRGTHLIKKGRAVEGALSYLHGAYSTARAYKLTQSEALLEANLAAQEYVMNMYHSGENFSRDQVEMIKRSAEAISNEVFWKNIPAIYLSNLVIFNDILSPVTGRFISKAFKGPNKLFGKMPQRLSHGKWYNQIYRVGEKVQRRSEYFAKGIPLFLGYHAGKGLKMFAVGSVEGIQENVQDIINYSAKKYYQDMYLNNERFQEVLGSSVDADGIWDAFKTDHLFGYKEAYSQQFTQQGWETFLTGTLMGGPTALISTTLRSGFKAGEFAIDKHKLNQLKKELNNTSKESSSYKELEKQYKAKEKAFNYKYDVDNVRSDEWLKIYDQVFNKPTDFFNKNLENIVNINATTEDTKEEIERFNNLINEVQDESLKEVLIQERDMAEERAKIRQWNMIFRQLCANGEIDLVKSELEHLKNEDDDVLSELNNGDNPEDVKKRIDECIKTIDLTQRVYDGLIDRFSNPQNMKGFLKKFNCKTEEEFLLKYGDNADIMQLYDNERMLGVAYSRAIDEMVYYANEYQIAEKDRLSLKKIIDKWFRFLDRIDSEEGEPVLPEEKKEDKSILGIIEKTNKGVEIENRYLHRDSALTDLTSLYTKESIASLMESNSVIIESLKSQLKDTENESERNELNDRIENFETRNKQLGIIVNSLNGYKTDEEGKILKDDNGKKIQLDAEEFSDTIQNALHKYMSIVQGGPNQDTLTDVFVDYFESYRNSSKLYDAYQTITNPRNFNAIIENRNRILMDIYNKRFEIIEKSIKRSRDVEGANDIINKLYEMGYAVDDVFVKHLLDPKNNKEFGNIYKITDKNFNKEEVNTSKGNISAYKYKNVDEAFKNSFDIKLNPLSGEFHEVVKTIIDFMKEKNPNVDISSLQFNLGDISDAVESAGFDAYAVNSVTDNTVEGIEKAMIDNDSDVLEVFQSASDKKSSHNMNDALKKIDEKLYDGNVFKELIKLLIDFNNKNKVQFIFDANYRIKRPYIIRQNAIIIDTRYFDKRYKSQHTNEGFGMAMLRANLEMMIHKELSKDSNKALALDLANALGIEVDGTFTGEDTERIIQGISTLMLRDSYSGTNITDRKVSDTLTRKLDETDPFYKFFDVLTSEASNNKSKEGVLDAISWLFKNVGKFVAPNPNTGTTAGTQQTQQEREVKNTITEPLSNITDITRNRINVPYDQLSTMEKYIILSDNGKNVNGNVNQWLILHSNEDSYKKDRNNIKKRTEEFELHQRINTKGSDLTGGDEFTIKQQEDLKNKIGNKSGIQYIFIDYLGISDDDIREYNRQIIDSNIFEGEQSNINSSVSAVTKLKEKFGIGTQNELVTYDDEKHQYTFTSIDGKSVDADTSASGFVDYLINVLGGKVEESTDDIISTVYGNIFDAAMRDYMQTGTLSDDVFDLIYYNGKSLNNTSGSTEDIAERNSIKNNIANTLIGTMSDIRNKLMEKIAGKDYDASKFSFNTDELRYVARVNIKGSDGFLRSFIVGMSHDMVVEYNGKTYVVDFKTHGGDNGITSDVKNHYNLQTYLYSKAIESSTVEKIDGRFVILKNLTETYDDGRVGQDNIEIAFGNKKYDVIEFTEEPSITVNNVKYTVDSVENVTDVEDISFEERKRNIVNSFNNLDHFDIDLLNVLVSDMTDEQKLEVYKSILDNAKYKRKINKNTTRIAMYVDENGITHYVTWNSNSNNLIPDNSVFYKNKPLTIGIIGEIAKITNTQQEVTEEVTVTNNNSLSQYIDMMNEVKKTNEDFDENKLRELLKEHCK